MKYKEIYFAVDRIWKLYKNRRRKGGFYEQ